MIEENPQIRLGNNKDEGNERNMPECRVLYRADEKGRFLSSNTTLRGPP